MKKLILLLLIAVSVSFTPAPYATTWTGTSTMQGITFAALKDGVTNGYIYQSPAVTIPNTLRLITKADIATYNILAPDITLSGKSSNQMVTKSDFMVIKIDTDPGQSACGGANCTQTIYLSTQDIGYSTICYTNKERTTVFVGDGTSWYAYTSYIGSCGGMSVKINSLGQVVDWFAC